MEITFKLFSYQIMFIINHVEITTYHRDICIISINVSDYVYILKFCTYLKPYSA